MSRIRRDEVINDIPVLKGHSKKSWEKIADSFMAISNNLWSIIFVSIITLPLGGIFNSFFNEKPFKLSFQLITDAVNSYILILFGLFSLAGILAILFRYKAIKIYDLLVVASVLVSCVLVTTNISAMELDQNQITNSDREYFKKVLTPEELEKLQQIGKLQYLMSKMTCDQEVAAVEYIITSAPSIVTIFKVAATSNELSDYARKYSESTSASLQKLVTVLSGSLSTMKTACAQGVPDKQDVEFSEQLIKWFTNSDNCVACKPYALRSNDRSIAGLKEFQEVVKNDANRLKALKLQFRQEVWDNTSEKPTVKK